MKILLLLSALISLASSAQDFINLPYQTILAKKPDTVGKNVRVWNIHKTDTIRINLVEFTGETPLHKHPDADHSLMVLEGRVKVQIGDKQFESDKGDFISVPKNIPHKYWAVGKKVMLVSMDAPYYDPKKTIPLE